MNRLMTVVAAAFTGTALVLAVGGHNFRWVDAGANLWRIAERGEHGPTVVFEAGAGGPLEAWVLVQPAVSRFARTLSYDRAGNGLSRKGAPPRDALNVAHELQSLLRHAGAAAPYILVGHSLGGPYIRMFADLYPSEVGGLVLVDPTQEELIAWAKARDTNRTHQAEAPRLDDEVGCAALTFSEITNRQIAPQIPVVLITGLGPREPPGFLSQSMRDELQKDQDSTRAAKLRFHRAWVEKFTRARIIITENSGHGIPFEEPDLIVEAIKEVIEQTGL
jgi:pimeloyl-ACP methyl ester carboxylesterase